jgi:hypothetical protein
MFCVDAWLSIRAPFILNRFASVLDGGSILKVSKIPNSSVVRANTVVVWELAEKIIVCRSACEVDKEQYR